MMMPIDLLNRATIALAQSGDTEALMRFTLFNRDVEGAVESLRIFVELKSSMTPKDNSRIIHHASCFVCAVRRSGRLLESMSANPNRGGFRDSVADVIRLEWKKKRAFFQSFIKPRNAIEHIDNETSDMTRWALFNLWNDKLAVTKELVVDVNQASLDQVCSARDSIAKAIVDEYPSPFPGDVQP